MNIPEAPKGYFFRIRPANLGPTYLRLDLRQKHLIGSSLVDFELIFVEESSDEIIASKMQKLLDARFPSPNTRVQELLGDYPPKQLGKK